MECQKTPSVWAIDLCWEEEKNFFVWIFLGLIIWTLGYLDHLLNTWWSRLPSGPLLIVWTSAQKKASLCSSRELGDTNDPGPLMKPHNTLGHNLKIPSTVSILYLVFSNYIGEGGNYCRMKSYADLYNTVPGRNYIVVWKAMQIWCHYTV